MTREMHLNIFGHLLGHHEAAWRHPRTDVAAHRQIKHFQNIAQIAERGMFDAFFVGDVPGLSYDPARRPWESIDPTVMLAAIAAVTDRIGLVGTASTTFEHPYNLARRFASVDFISGGRAGWNMVTTGVASAAENFGYVEMPTIPYRYERGEEFLEVVLGLWAGTEENAVSADREAGVYTDGARLHPINHVGKHFRVAGPLDMDRSPQGWPVVVQAGSSGPGMALAARYADVIFTAQAELEDSREFYAAIKRDAAGFGRNADHVAVMPGIMPILGGTEAEAKALQDEINEGMILDFGHAQLSRDTGVPIEELDLDSPLPDEVRSPDEIPGIRSRYELTLKIARQDNLTVRQLLVRLGQSRAHNTVVGTPEQVADVMEEWFTTGAADGFNVMPPLLPSGLEEFVEHVVPLLQKREIFRREYSATTFRGHLGIPVPAAAHRRT